MYVVHTPYNINKKVETDVTLSAEDSDTDKYLFKYNIHISNKDIFSWLKDKKNQISTNW